MSKKISISKFIPQESNYIEEQRIVRKKVNFGDGEIEIYEPNDSQIKEILAIQEGYFKNNKTNMDKKDVLYILIPMLTNLDFTGIEDETIIMNLIENPPMYLKMVTLELEGLLSEVNLLRVIEMKTQIKDTEYLLEQSEIMNNMPKNVSKFIGSDKDILTKDGIENYNIIKNVVDNVIKLPKEETEQERIARELTEKKMREIEELEAKIKSLKGE